MRSQYHTILIIKATVSALKEWAEYQGVSLTEALLLLDEWTSISRTPKQALSHFS